MGDTAVIPQRPRGVLAESPPVLATPRPTAPEPPRGKGGDYGISPSTRNIYAAPQMIRDGRRPSICVPAFGDARAALRTRNTGSPRMHVAAAKSRSA